MAHVYSFFGTEAFFRIEFYYVHFSTRFILDFVPFDVESYLTERFLRDVNLDPKILNGFCK